MTDSLWSLFSGSKFRQCLPLCAGRERDDKSSQRCSLHSQELCTAFWEICEKTSLFIASSCHIMHFAFCIIIIFLPYSITTNLEFWFGNVAESMCCCSLLLTNYIVGSWVSSCFNATCFGVYRLDLQTSSTLGQSTSDPTEFPEILAFVSSGTWWVHAFCGK